MARNPQTIDRPAPASSTYLPLSELALRASSILGAVRFGVEASPNDASPRVSLRQLGREELAEVWLSDLPVRRGFEEGLNFAENGEVLFGSATLAGSEAIEVETRHTYDAMIRFIRAAGYPSFLRIWNHLPDINLDERRLERYQRFSVGRAEAFAAAGYALREDLPAASAVGSHGGAPVIFFLASRTPGQQLENPRQVSAFAYPRQYGPKSPSFSRATLKRWDGAHQLFLSGTASIVGHESVHRDDLDAQLEETMRNIEALLTRASQSAAVELRMSDVSSMKIYVRHAEDVQRVELLLRRYLPLSASLLFLEADICRRELLLEIEAIFYVKDT